MGDLRIVKAVNSVSCTLLSFLFLPFCCLSYSESVVSQSHSFVMLLHIHTLLFFANIFLGVRASTSKRESIHELI